MNRIFRILSLLFTVGYINAQSPVVFGIIKDLDSGEGIEYATILQTGTKNAVESDLNGLYKINIPANTHIKLKVVRVGYEDVEVSIAPMYTGQKRNINVEMASKNTGMEIYVRAGKIEDVGMVREEVTELKILPSASGNFESILPHIALGVNAGAGGELTSQYSVRGGNYDENLIYVNDFEIFRPQLIRSGQQEGLSFPNIDLIRNLEFSSGGFESKYGDKMSSVLDIRYKIPTDFRGSATASLLGTSLHLEGSSRIGKNAYNKLRYLLGWRYKSNANLLSSLDVKGEYVPTFMDVQAYISYELSKVFQVSLISNYNTSNYNFKPASGKSKKGTIDYQIELNTIFEGQENDNFKYAMSGASLIYVPERTKNPLVMKLLFSGYRAAEEEKYDILGYYRLSQIESAIGQNTGKEIAVLGTGTQHTYTRNYLFNQIYNIEYKGGLELQNADNKLDPTHFFQWSVKYQHEFFEDKLNEWERLDSAGYSLPYNGNTIGVSKYLRTQNELNNDKWQAYVQDAFSIRGESHELKIIGGVRATYRSISEELLFSPRVQIYYRPLLLNKSISFKLSGGVYNQSPVYREMRRPDGTVNTDLKSQKSIHVVGGMSYDFDWPGISKKPFRIISELYYKKLDDMVSYEVDNVRISYAGENNSRGYITGLDFRVNGEFVPGAESWINLSFLRAREAINGVNHLRYTVVDSVKTPYVVNDVPRPTDQLMTLNMFFQDYLPKNENIKVNLNFSVGTGLPYGPRENNVEFRNFFRFKPYKRIDVGFSFQLWKQEWKQTKPKHILAFAQNSWLSIEAFNLLGIANQASVNWIKTLLNEEYALPNNLTGRRLNVKLRVDF